MSFSFFNGTRKMVEHNFSRENKTTTTRTTSLTTNLFLFYTFNSF